MTNSTHRNRLRQYAPSPLADVDNLFQHFFGPAVASAVGWQAPASVWEGDDRMHVEVDAPGVARDGVDVTFDKGTLTIELNRPTPEGRTFAHNERGFGKLTRTLALPDTVDPASIEAELTDGVLSVSVAKRPEAKPRKIDLKS